MAVHGLHSGVQVSYSGSQMTPYEIHERIAENVAKHAPMVGLGIPDKVTLAEKNDDDIPAGSYVQNEDGIWVMDS